MGCPLARFASYTLSNISKPRNFSEYAANFRKNAAYHAKKFFKIAYHCVHGILKCSLDIRTDNRRSLHDPLEYLLNGFAESNDKRAGYIDRAGDNAERCLCCMPCTGKALSEYYKSRCSGCDNQDHPAEWRREQSGVKAVLCGCCPKCFPFCIALYIAVTKTMISSSSTALIIMRVCLFR